MSCQSLFLILCYKHFNRINVRVMYYNYLDFNKKKQSVFPLTIDYSRILLLPLCSFYSFSCNADLVYERKGHCAVFLGRKINFNNAAPHPGV